MTRIEDIKDLAWIEPYYEYIYTDGDDEVISSLKPLQNEDDSLIKIRINRNNNFFDPFVTFCKSPEVEKIINDNGSMFDLRYAPHLKPKYGIVFDIDDFVTHFSDKSIYICDKDFVTKSTLKAINKKARQWRRAGAQYIILY